MALDAPSREVCTIRRVTTNTPIAAFALLNDPAYIEAAQALARVIDSQQQADAESRVAYAFQKVVVRPPTKDEVQSLVKLYNSELEYYRGNSDAAAKMASSEAGPPSAGSDASELAAWTVVANVLLNLDETLSK
jgi:hypothetical protein